MGLTRADIVTIAVRTGWPVKQSWGPGHGEMGTVVGVMEHHTATPDSIPGDIPTLGWLMNGQELGTCCNYGLARSGTIHCVSEKIAYHSGVGSYEGITDGNGHFLGIEGESGGAGVWSAEQRDCYPRLVASILDFLGAGPEWAIRHARWALPAGRKRDTAGMDFTPVAGYLANPATITRRTTPEETFMAGLTDEQQQEVLTTLKAIAGSVVRMDKNTFGQLAHDYAKASRLDARTAVQLLRAQAANIPLEVARLLSERTGELTADDVEATVRAVLLDALEEPEPAPEPEPEPTP